MPSATRRRANRSGELRAAERRIMQKRADKWQAIKAASDRAHGWPVPTSPISGSDA